MPKGVYVRTKECNNAHKVPRKPNLKNKYAWKCGRFLSNGYVLIYYPNHPFGYKNHVLEHRLVVEQHIGRYLAPHEIVHHENRIKTDNSPKNLMCFSSVSPHMIWHRNPSEVKSENIIFNGPLIFQNNPA